MLTVGDIFKKAREAKGCTLNDIEKSTKIRQKFLTAVESNNWKIFSSKIYIIGIVKNYARFLEVPVDKAIAYFQRDYERTEEIKFKRRLSTSYLTSQTRRLFTLIILLIFGTFFLYFGFQLKNYFSPPKIEIILPKTDIIKKGNTVKIVGKTDKDAVITISGEAVFKNKQGIFEFDHPLKLGKNIIFIEVTGANGRKTTLKKEFILQASNP